MSRLMACDAQPSANREHVTSAQTQRALWRPSMIAPRMPDRVARPDENPSTSEGTVQTSPRSESADVARSLHQILVNAAKLGGLGSLLASWRFFLKFDECERERRQLETPLSVNPASEPGGRETFAGAALSRCEPVVRFPPRLAAFVEAQRSFRQRTVSGNEPRQDAVIGCRSLLVTGPTTQASPHECAADSDRGPGSR